MFERERPESCLSDLAIDRRIAGELTADELAKADEHFASCRVCTHRRDALAADKVDDLWVAGAMKRASAAMPASRPSWKQWVAIGAPLAAAAALVIWFALPKQPDDTGVRTKGGLAIEIAVKRADGSTPILGVDPRVAPGESIRFLITTDRPGYLAVLGIDSVRQVSRYVPDPGVAMPAIAVGSRQAQPGSVVLDQTPGMERFIAIVCEAPIDLDELVVAIQRALPSVADARDLERVPTPCAQASFVVEKAP